jgi:alpha-glucosidase
MASNKTLKQHRWPEGAIVYQIYPRSFYDANHDGIGDIPGITQKLDYLDDLGINAIWLSPFYSSPMADFGYDVADYCDVDPIFGNLSDMNELIKQAHKHNIKIMVDLVPNHSSDEHEWFRQSRQSKEDKYSDWYIWRDAKGKDDNGKPIPPNNWLDIFTGETAWEWEPAREQFYLHSFDVHQPDLNWANPEVREAIKSAMRFWLDMGVDGFRVDAVRFMGKDPLFKNNPPNPDYVPGEWSKYGSIKHIYSQGRPQLYAYLSEMAAVLKEKQYASSPRFMVTESYPETKNHVREYLAFYEGMDPDVAAPFNFEGLGLPWEAGPWVKFLDKFHKALDDFSPLCVASYAFGNHDQHRLATRLGDSAARSAAVLLLTLPGMSFVYNGEEIGMVNGHVDPNSFLTLYKKLAKLRNNSDAMRWGSFKIIKTGHSDVLCFNRAMGKTSHIVVVNFSEKLAVAKLPKNLQIGNFEISSDLETKHKNTEGNKVQLLPNEAAVFTS